MSPTRIIFVGGFLGAGKTTLLWRAAELLARRGKRVGLITNDQAPDLVDTKFRAGRGLRTYAEGAAVLGRLNAGIHPATRNPHIDTGGRDLRIGLKA